MEKARLYDVETIDQAVLVVVDPRDYNEVDANTEELLLLSESAGVQIVDEMHIRRPYPDSRFYIGSGNAEEIFLLVQESGANVVIVGVDLSPTQQRNLEKATSVRIVDRTQLILDIFAQRARTGEGKIQVELAQLQYLLPRLTGKGTEMSRVGGGSAGGLATRGPGETKLETDRKRIRKRISILKDELEQVVKHRSTQNQARRKLFVPNVALVGYTSAGKSTLLNKLTGADVYADSKLFATLDPTTRRVDLDSGHTILLSDTVGFLHNLPHHLIAAFRATLEEVVEADFLIHVVDVSHPYVERQCESVKDVLAELEAQDKPTITVFNKSDRVKDQYDLRKMIADTENSCYMSALTGEGMQYLMTLINKTIAALSNRIQVLLPYDRGDLLALCHERGRVIQMEYRPEGIYVEAELSPELTPRIAQYEYNQNDKQE